MQTVVENPSFKASAKAAGMTETEIAALVSYLAGNPMAGVLVQEAGGIRKVRFAKTGGGKSGGYRVFYIVGAPEYPLFLLWVLNKRDAENLTKAQRNALAAVAKQLFENYLR